MKTSGILCAVTNHENLKNICLTVCAIDQLPFEIPSRRPLAFIFNTAKSFHSGEHWVCLYFPSFGNIEFFDSYGRDPRKYDCFTKNVYDLVTNTRTLQHRDSRVCGQYCLYFLDARCKGKSFREIIHQFGIDKTENDWKVLSFAEKNFSLHRHTDQGQTCVKRTDSVFNKSGR